MRILLLICLHENHEVEAECNKAGEHMIFNQNIDLLQTRNMILHFSLILMYNDTLLLKVN